MTINNFYENSEIKKIIHGIASCSIDISNKLRIAAINNLLGEAGSQNIQEENVQKLDIISNEIIIQHFKENKICFGILSEENENPIFLDNNSNLLMCMDPLDGSSNIDVNVSVGTIFGIYKKKGVAKDNSIFLQSGKNQIMAGYVLYGTSTTMLICYQNKVNIFTLNPEDNKYYLSHKNIKTPVSGKIYSMNEGNTNIIRKGYVSYLKECHHAIDGRRTKTSRFIGSLVADFHRNLLKGGIFIYPETKSHPEGRLRLMYECNPLAMIIKAAGGDSSNGKISILDIQPTSVHQRSSLIIGSTEMVTNAIKYL